MLAAGDGTVIFAGNMTGFGNTVQIDNGAGVMTLYGHLSSIGVSVGQSVSDGDQIALSGNTGTTSGPNLHFGVYENGSAVDPMLSLAPAVDYSNIDALLPDLTAPDLSTVDTSSTDTSAPDLAAAGGDLSTYFSDLFASSPASTAGVSPVLIAGAALGVALVLHAAFGSNS